MGSKAARIDVEELVGQLREARLPSPATRRRIREEAGVTLREAAAVLGVHPVTVLRWEHGRVPPRRENATAYKRLLRTLEKVAADA